MLAEICYLLPSLLITLIIKSFVVPANNITSSEHTCCKHASGVESIAELGHGLHRIWPRPSEYWCEFFVRNAAQRDANIIDSRHHYY